ncbi:MAG: MBL fold metallo-hydrolase, partial [Lentisphaeria bacterium]|nr:MBL fold metallo-hydrolase [Lentisphaeria bacterium]
ISTLLTLTGMGGAFLMARFGSLPTAAETAQWKELENYRDGRFHNLETNDFAAKKAVRKSGCLKFLFNSKNAPSFPIPQKQDRHSNAPLKDAFSVYWLGHSSLIFELGDARFMTDPVFGNAAPVPGIVTRYCEPPIRRAELPELDFIIVSHDHYDHLEYATIRALKDTEIIFVTPVGVGARLRSFGIKPENIRELYWYESTQIGNTTITAAPGRHFSGRTLKDRYKTLWASWIIETAEKRSFSAVTAATENISKRSGKSSVLLISSVLKLMRGTKTGRTIICSPTNFR